ncbi:hypothetical protein [Ruegeria conchae]|uniref:hypothetical protein n=1 Tax=Ruegeria conchae TaxID=981384 RepID=UPI0011C3C382|nr:hypothetical protein [Ruegeria conchae]
MYRTDTTSAVDGASLIAIQSPRLFSGAALFALQNFLNAKSVEPNTSTASRVTYIQPVHKSVISEIPTGETSGCLEGF